MEVTRTKLEKAPLGWPAVVFFKGTVPNSPLLTSGHPQQKPLSFLGSLCVPTGFLGWGEGGEGRAAISWEGQKKRGAIWKA